MCKCIFLSLLTVLLIGGCGGGGNGALTGAELERAALVQKIELVEAEGGLVLVVGGETITSDEIIESPTQLNNGMFVSPMEHFRPIAQISDLEQFKKRAGGQIEEILAAKISNIMLYQHARRQAGNNIDESLEKAAENEYRKFILDFGGDQAKADEVLKQNRMDRESFKEQQRRSILIQWYVASKLPGNRPVTYRELMDCYNRMKDESFARTATMTFRLIDIQPDELEVADPNEDRQWLAKELAYKLLARIQSGEDFGELAKQYSHGHRREFGGLWKPVQPQSLAVPYDRLAAEAEKIESGQIVKPIAAEDHVFIMKLEERQSAGYEPLEKVQEQVREKVILDRRSEAFDRLNAKLMRQAELGRTDEFVDFCLEKIHRMSKQQQ
ncbi:MAG: peptidylprolyl isomerase [Planctomycetota bacterium]|jgi:parvulin-like peptidyl-prolyl isomerase